MYFAKVFFLIAILLQLSSCISTNTYNKYKGCEIVNGTFIGLKTPGKIACFDKIQGDVLRVYYESYRHSKSRTLIKFSLYDKLSNISKSENPISKYTISSKKNPIYLLNVCYNGYHHRLYAKANYKELEFEFRKLKSRLKRC